MSIQAASAANNAATTSARLSTVAQASQSSSTPAKPSAPPAATTNAAALGGPVNTPSRNPFMLASTTEDRLRNAVRSMNTPEAKPSVTPTKTTVSPTGRVNQLDTTQQIKGGASQQSVGTVKTRVNETTTLNSGEDNKPSTERKVNFVDVQVPIVQSGALTVGAELRTSPEGQGSARFRGYGEVKAGDAKFSIAGGKRISSDGSDVNNVEGKFELGAKTGPFFKSRVSYDQGQQAGKPIQTLTPEASVGHKGRNGFSVEAGISASPINLRDGKAAIAPFVQVGGENWSVRGAATIKDGEVAPTAAGQFEF